MEIQNVSPVKTAMRWGLILGLIGIVISVTKYLLGGFTPENYDSGMSQLLQYLMYAIVILVLILAMQQHRDKELDGFMKYGRGLGLGTLIGLFYGIIACITTFVMVKFLLPADLGDKIIDMTREKMLEKNPSMTEDQMEMGLGWVRRMTTPGVMSLMSLFGGVFICFLFSLIVSAFVKKSNPNAFE